MSKSVVHLSITFSNNNTYLFSKALPEDLDKLKWAISEKLLSTKLVASAAPLLSPTTYQQFDSSPHGMCCRPSQGGQIFCKKQ